MSTHAPHLSPCVGIPQFEHGVAAAKKADNDISAVKSEGVKFNSQKKNSSYFTTFSLFTMQFKTCFLLPSPF